MIFHSTSKKPILLVGNGVRSAEAITLIREFSNKTKIPVLTTMNSVDLWQGDDRIGFIGVYGNRAANMIISECDLVISVGARLSLRQIGKDPKKFAPKAKLIRVDIDPAELSRDIKVDEAKHLTDAKQFMEKLLKEDIPKYEQWSKICLEVKRELDGLDRALGNTVIEKISELLPINPIVAVDVGQHQCWSAQSLAIKGDNGRIIIGGGYGSMGCGVPYAIGASISNNKDIVFCITGDGGLQMNIQELETIVREKLPVKILVLNNYALAKISEVQAKSYNERYAQTTAQSGYTVPDFKRISEAYGIKAVSLPSYEMLNDYKDWLLDNEPCLVNIQMPSDTKLIPKVQWNTMEILPKINDDVTTRVLALLDSI